jgi:putative tricarboxylic transport membrane protein
METGGAMTERLRRALPYAVLLIAAGLLYYATTLIDAPGSGGGRLGPDFWPKVIIAAMALLCIYEIGKRLIVGSTHDAQGLTAALTHAPREAEGTPVISEKAAEETLDNRKLVAGVVLIAAFVFGVAYVGFFIGTALFLASFSWVGGYRRPLSVALVSLIGAFVLLVIFMRIAYVSLPLGIGPFQQVSTLLLRLPGL